MMRPIFMSVFAITVLSPLICEADDKTQWKKLSGNWNATSMLRGGKELMADKTFTLSLKIAPNKFSLTWVRKNDKTYKESTNVKVDFSKTPNQIDFLKDGKITDRGILKVEGKKLLICSQSGTEKKRPTTFESKAGSSVFLMVLKRAKKE